MKKKNAVANDVPEVPQDRESGEYNVAIERDLGEHAYHAIGSFGASDDDPVISCLDALAVDMRILEVALQAETCEHGVHEQVEDAIGRFVARVKAIRELQAKRSNDAFQERQRAKSDELGVILKDIEKRTEDAHKLCAEDWQTELCSDISQAVVEALIVLRNRSEVSQ